MRHRDPPKPSRSGKPRNIEAEVGVLQRLLRTKIKVEGVRAVIGKGQMSEFRAWLVEKGVEHTAIVMIEDEINRRKLKPAQVRRNIARIIKQLGVDNIGKVLSEIPFAATMNGNQLTRVLYDEKQKRKKRTPLTMKMHIPFALKEKVGTGEIEETDEMKHIRKQLEVFGVKIEVIGRIIDKIKEDDSKIPQIMLNLFILHREVIDEDLGKYIEQKPHTLTMSHQLLGRSLGLHPHEIPRAVPRILQGKILEKRKPIENDEVNGKTREARARAEEVKVGLRDWQVGNLTIMSIGERLPEYPYDPKQACENIVRALVSLSAEETMQLLERESGLCTKERDEIEELVREHQEDKLIKILERNLPFVTLNTEIMRATVEVCGSREKIHELAEKVGLLRQQAEQRDICQADVNAFIRENLTRIVGKENTEILERLAAHTKSNGNGNRTVNKIEKLRHARETRVRGMDRQALHALVRETGFEITSTSSGGGGHFKIEYNGERVVTEEGRPVIITTGRTSGDLSYGVVANLLDNLIAFLEKKR